MHLFMQTSMGNHSENASGGSSFNVSVVTEPTTNFKHTLTLIDSVHSWSSNLMQSSRFMG